MYREFLVMEHHRLHVMESWPDGPRKEAGLAAVRATLEGLQKTPPSGAAHFECVECLSHRHHRARLFSFPPHHNPLLEKLAA